MMALDQLAWWSVSSEPAVFRIRYSLKSGYNAPHNLATTLHLRSASYYVRYTQQAAGPSFNCPLVLPAPHCHSTWCLIKHVLKSHSAESCASDSSQYYYILLHTSACYAGNILVMFLFHVRVHGTQRHASRKNNTC